MRSVLVIEFHQSLQNSLNKVLRQLGFNHIVFVDCGQEGLSTVSREEFDLIIMDNELPDGMGFDIFQELKKSNNDNPIMLISSFDEATDIAKYKKVGVKHFLSTFKIESNLPQKLREVIYHNRRTRASQRQMNTEFAEVTKGLFLN